MMAHTVLLVIARRPDTPIVQNQVPLDALVWNSLYQLWKEKGWADAPLCKNYDTCVMSVLLR